MEYASEGVYIATAASLKEKIAKIDSIISALEIAAGDSASKAGIEEYMLDDGQSKIRTNYRSINSILDSILSFEKLKQMYLNQLNGRVFRLLPGTATNNVR